MLRDVKVNETVLDLSQSDCKVIPRNAMHSCHRLTSLTLPPKLDSIGTQAFFACDGISGKLYFPATTRVVDASAFNGCRQLTELSFDGSTRIGAFALLIVVDFVKFVSRLLFLLLVLTMLLMV